MTSKAGALPGWPDWAEGEGRSSGDQVAAMTAPCRSNINKSHNTSCLGLPTPTLYDRPPLHTAHRHELESHTEALHCVQVLTSF
jgi:hypothetical protein